jgi:BlaI family transcriptional regulator, penicillinase repressor
MSDPFHLSRRERQIMEVIYARGESTALEVLGDLPDPPSRTAVRTFLRILEEKGHLTHRQRGREFVYRPIRPRTQAARAALRRLLSTFFEGSMERAVAAHLADPKTRLSGEQFARLRELIDEAQRREELKHDTH